MKKPGGIFLAIIIAISLVFWAAPDASAEDSGRTYPVMHPDRETLDKWIESYNNAPLAYIDKKGFQVPSPRGSQNLLSHLEYTPSQRDQGDCGNCWAWTGTGCLGIALDVQEGIRDRLSIQYLNSCYNGGSGSDWACCGGQLEDLTSFYTTTGMAIPWSNTNASWQDGSQECEQSTTVPAATISTTPNYPITSIQAETVSTQAVPQVEAITNIKSVLNDDKAIWFALFLPNSNAWADFYAFWNTDNESVVYDIDKSCGIPYDPDNGGGHAVLCVGYNDENPNNKYWIMLNSWGTPAGRPNGLFRVNMDMAYDGANSPYYSFYWETLDVSFGSATPDITVTPPSFDVTLAPSTTQNYNLIIGNAGDATLTYNISDFTSGGDCPWLDENPKSGSVTPGAQQNITITINTAGLAVGNYNAEIVIANNDPDENPKIVPVALHVAATAPTIGFSPTNFSFSATKGGTNPANQTLEIWNSGVGTLNWFVSDDAAWLGLSPPSGSSTGEHDNVTLSVNTSGMPAATYASTITISAPGAMNTPQTVPVNLTITPAGGEDNPPLLVYGAVTIGGDPAPVPTTISAEIDGVQVATKDTTVAGTYNINVPDQGAAEVTVLFYVDGMLGGQYTGIVAGFAIPAGVALDLAAGVVMQPIIGYSPATFSFSAQQGGANPAIQTLNIWNAGFETLDWSVVDGATWLSLNPSIGSSTGETDSVTASVNIAGLGVGTYYATITITGDGATNSPQYAEVTLSVTSAGDQNNPPVATGLASLGTNLVIAWGYQAGESTGGWTFYNPLLPEMSTLEILRVGRGYWVNVTLPCTLEYGTKTYPLAAGWNLIGWLGW